MSADEAPEPSGKRVHPRAGRAAAEGAGAAAKAPKVGGTKGPAGPRPKRARAQADALLDDAPEASQERLARRIVHSFEPEVDPAEVGAKAAQLNALGHAGLPVPGWFCLTAGNDSAPPSAAELERILQTFDATLADASLAAIRASVVSRDDLPAWDPASLFESFLFVDREALAPTIASCLASARTPSALLERKVRGLDQRPPLAAVMVQAMVDARVSGSFSTAFEEPPPPEKGHTGPPAGPRVRITAGLGLGVGVAGDLVEADAYLADLTTGSTVEAHVVRQRSRVVLDAERGRGTTLEEVPQAEGSPRALSDGEVARLCKLARKVAEQLPDAAQRVEWALDRQGAFHLIGLQPAPTQLEQVFDDGPLLEAFPGLCPPLTYSLASRLGADAAPRALTTLGQPQAAAAEARAHAPDLLVLINGRLTLNLVTTQRLVRSVPGWQRTLGGFEEQLRVPRRLSAAPSPSSRWAMLRAGLRARGLSLGLPRRVRRFARRVDATQAELAERIGRQADAHELYHLSEVLVHRLAPGVEAALVADALARIARRDLDEAIARAGLAAPEALASAYLCGTPGHPALEPVRSFLAIAELAAADTTLRELLASTRALSDPEEVEATLRGRPGAAMREALARHRAEFSDRVPQELNLESPTLRDSRLLVGLLRDAVAQSKRSGIRLQTHRQRARADVAKMLATAPLARRLGLRWRLRRWRRLELWRERARFACVRMVAALRDLYLAIGRELAATGLLAAPADVVWLTTEEVTGLFRTQTVDRDLRSLVSLRKGEYERFVALPPVHRVTTRGVVAANYLAGSWVERYGPIRGTGCSPGRVQGRARVLPGFFDGETRVDGEILVATSVGPGHGLMLAAASGLVIEAEDVRHVGALGRELGIPTVVGVRGATRRLRDGQAIEIDGATGEVLSAAD